MKNKTLEPKEKVAEETEREIKLTPEQKAEIEKMKKFLTDLANGKMPKIADLGIVRVKVNVEDETFFIEYPDHSVNIVKSIEEVKSDVEAYGDRHRLDDPDAMGATLAVQFEELKPTARN